MLSNITNCHTVAQDYKLHELGYSYFKSLRASQTDIISVNKQQSQFNFRFDKNAPFEHITITKFDGLF